MTSDWILGSALVCLACTVYYLLYRERRHKSILAFQQKQLWLYSLNPDKLEEYKTTLSKTTIEQKLYLLYSIFGKGRVIKAMFKVYNFGIVLDGIFADDENLDEKKKEKFKVDYIS